MMFMLFIIEAPLGVIPVLHTEGKVLSGNGNIARYLAEKFGNDSVKLVLLTRCSCFFT